MLEILPPVAETDLFQAFLKRGVLLVPGSKCMTEDDGTWFRMGYGFVASDKLERGLKLVSEAVGEFN